jgi:PAS domain S-box-containing protein
MMSKGKAKTGKFKELRARAEKDLKKKAVKRRVKSSGDPEKVLHELHVHQIELEMQNEELRRAQKELEDSRNKYSDLYDFAPVGYFTFDKNGLVIEANLAGCQMLGVERSNLIKKPFRVFVGKDSQDDFYLHRQGVSRSDKKQNCEIALVRKDKTTLEVMLESIPATSADGKLTLCRTAMTDITERKSLVRLKEAIHQQAIAERNRLEAVMEALPTGVAIIDEKGGNIESNAAFEQVWGGPRPPTRNIKDYAKYKAWWADTGKPVKPEEWASAQAILKGKTVINQSFEIQRFDGSHAFILNSASPVLDADSKIIGSAIAIQDITELRRIEEALRESEESEEQLHTLADSMPNLAWWANGDGYITWYNRRWYEYTGTTPEQMEGWGWQSAHDPQTLPKVLDQWKASIATGEPFDMVFPLRGAISGFVQLLDQRYKDKWDEKGKEFIKYATDGAKRIEELLNGLLEYSRVQTQGQRVMPLPAGVALRAAIKNLQKSIDETGASITFDELPDVNADGSQLTRVFQNLIDNAIKFHGDRKPEIHIGCQKEGNYRQFSVRDNGIGIDQQYHGRIFKIFQHLYSHDQYPGYGVGLTVCQKIVERRGGRIWVESQPGQGTTFYFTIPE